MRRPITLGSSRTPSGETIEITKPGVPVAMLSPVVRDREDPLGDVTIRELIDDGCR